MCHEYCVTFPLSHITCHMSHVKCHMSTVTHHLSLMPTATGPHLANFPTMHSRLVSKEQKPKNIKHTNFIKTLQKKGVLSFPILAIRSLTRNLQLFRLWLSKEGTYIFLNTHTDIAYTRLNPPRG